MRKDAGVSGMGWIAVIPVKRLATAKTRLRGAISGVPHDQLVLAMAHDTLTGALACPLVSAAFVVTDDPAVIDVVTGSGARRVPDGRGGVNAALARGARQAAGSPVIALTADLPALRPHELTAVLTTLTATPGLARGFVPDTAGTGTAMLAARAGVELDPRFGPGSAAAHRSSGAVALLGDWPSVRRDVDTAADLAEAAALGLGRHTATLIGTATPGAHNGGARYGGSW
jgi:2-phospho-L-lactate guanylyltransferase